MFLIKHPLVDFFLSTLYERQKMAEANGNRTHPGPSRPYTGFEDQGHHQAPVTSASGSFPPLINYGNSHCT